jgi:deoxyadenosine/deoxycytidine kinase
MKKFIAIAGNVGVGKSTLTTLLCEFYLWEPFYEAVDDNPYLADFYRDMKTWAFHSQIFFLSRRLSHHAQILKRPGTVIQDRTVYEDAEVFARNLYEQGDISERDYGSYRALYETVIHIIPPPDLLIYLQASVPTLLARIHKRGRDYEQGISAGYLEQLNRLYEEWIEQFTLCPVLTIPTDSLDFVRNDAHLAQISARVLDKLHGKEVVVFDGGEG